MLGRDIKYRMEITNAYRILMGKSEGKRRLLSSRRGWDSTASGQDAMVGSCERGSFGSINGGGGGGISCSSERLSFSKERYPV
jgi:hypothetical protein